MYLLWLAYHCHPISISKTSKTNAVIKASPERGLLANTQEAEVEIVKTFDLFLFCDI